MVYTYLGKSQTPMTGSSVSISIPSGSVVCYLSVECTNYSLTATEYIHLDVNGSASGSSPIYVTIATPQPLYLGSGVSTLTAIGAAGLSLNAVFYKSA